jgi:mRNA-degrading endonuclease toxin of MazEF toxin-antitoxin module
MKFSDIKSRHIYNVDFDPVKDNEFNGLHLAVVLKKNNDKRTAIVMPLTSVPNGLGANKIEIHPFDLPSSFSVNPSYAVYNQIRTLNANRFRRIKDDNRNPIDITISEEEYIKLISLGINELIFDYDIGKRVEVLESIYFEQKVIKAKSIAYDIKNSHVDTDGNEKLYSEIKKLVSGITVQYSEAEIDYGIEEIISDILKK